MKPGQHYALYRYQQRQPKRRIWFLRSTWRYPALSFWENFFGGHVSLGPITIYGENAMHWAVNIKCRGGWFCFRLPLRCYGKYWGLYCYHSPNGTPQDATWWGWGRNRCD